MLGGGCRRVSLADLGVVVLSLVEAEVEGEEDDDDVVVDREVVVVAHSEVPGVVGADDVVLGVVCSENIGEMVAVHRIRGRLGVVPAMAGYMPEVVVDFLGLGLGAEVVDLEDIDVAVHHHLAKAVVGDIAAAAEIGNSLELGVIAVPASIVGGC